MQGILLCKNGNSLLLYEQLQKENVLEKNQGKLGKVKEFYSAKHLRTNGLCYQNKWININKNK